MPSPFVDGCLLHVCPGSYHHGHTMPLLNCPRGLYKICMDTHTHTHGRVTFVGSMTNPMSCHLRTARRACTRSAWTHRQKSSCSIRCMSTLDSMTSPTPCHFWKFPCWTVPGLHEVLERYPCCCWSKSPSWVDLVCTQRGSWHSFCTQAIVPLTTPVGLATVTGQVK